ncbi:MAG: right-handed parallel beta-helix repeat-containing protein [Candidatus Coproplasma sp.]
MKKFFKFVLPLLLTSALVFGVFGCTPSDADKTPSDVESGENTDKPADSEDPSQSGGDTDDPADSEDPSQSDGDTDDPADSEDPPEQTETSLTYNQKMERYMYGMQSTAFTDYVTGLEQYDYNAAVVSNAIYAAPNGNGDGTIDSPYSLQDGLDEVKAGQTLYLRGGIYSTSDADGWFINCKGSENNFITIRNYPGEKAIIENTYKGDEAYGFQFEDGTKYILLEGIEISSVQSQCAYGIVFWGNGQNNIIIRNCDIHDIKTTSANPESDDNAGANAILLFGEKATPVTDVAIIDNHCYNNVNGWSENISVTANCERVYVIGNTVENNTNIGIDFYGNAGYCKTPSLDQPRDCLAAGNTVKDCICSYADCAGLYVDGARDVLLQSNYISGCAYGIEIGSEERNDDYPVKNITVRANMCVSNTVTGIRIGGYEETATGVVQSTYIYNNTLINNGADDGAGIILAKLDGVEFVNNVICVPAGVSLISTDFGAEYTKNFTFKNNLFYITGSDASGVSFNICGTQISGFASFNGAYGGTNVYGDPLLDGTYMPTNAYSGDSTVNFGKYDYNLTEWGQTPNIGAVKG